MKRFLIILVLGWFYEESIELFFLGNNYSSSTGLYICSRQEANNKADKKTETTTTISKTTINEAGRKALVQRWNDPGFTEAGFPQKESFWIFIKSPPNPADAYAALACKIAKSEYNVKGFTITVWDFNKKKYGKARCY